MEPDDLQALRTRLEAARDELIAEGDVKVDPNRPDPTNNKTDEDAQPLNEMNQAIASKRNQERVARLRGIEMALRKMQQEPEDFGLCESCEEEIAERRLELMPWVKFCVRCQGKRDQDRHGRRRHLGDMD